METLPLHVAHLRSQRLRPSCIMNLVEIFEERSEAKEPEHDKPT